MEPLRLDFDIPGVAPLPASHRLACYQWGRSDAIKTIFCVHGLTRNGRDFDFLASALAADFRVICFDMPGRGKSDWLPDAAAYNYGIYIADILWVMNSMHLPQVHWVGTSMGGIIGMMLAASQPGRIASMMLNDIGALIPAAGLKRIMGYVGVNTQFDTREHAEAVLRANCAPYGITDESHWRHLLMHSVEEAPQGTFRLAYDPAIARGFPPADKIEDVNLWPFFQSLAMLPVLVVRGEQSDILLRDTALEMQEKHPGCTLYEVPNAGHAPALMADDQVSFVANWCRKASG